MMSWYICSISLRRVVYAFWGYSGCLIWQGLGRMWEGLILVIFAVPWRGRKGGSGLGDVIPSRGGCGLGVSVFGIDVLKQCSTRLYDNFVPPVED